MKKNHSDKKHHGDKTIEYLIAFLFIAAGLLLLGKNLNIIHPDIYRTLMSWQILLIVLGIYTLLKKEYTGGLILLTTGSYFLVSKLGLVTITFMNLFWPVILIIIGLYFIFHINRKKRKYALQKKKNSKPLKLTMVLSIPTINSDQ